MKVVKNTVKANNFKQAYAELAEIDKVEADKLTGEIDENDRGHNVVLCIQRINNEAKKNYETRLSIQQFDQQSFEKLQSNFQFLGFDSIILLHKAEKVETPVAAPVTAAAAAVEPAAAVTAPAAPVVGKTEEQIREEMRLEFEKKYEGYVPAPAAPPVSGSISAEDQEELDKKAKLQGFVDTDLSKIKSIDGLAKFAQDAEIDITGLAKYADIKDALVAWQTETAAELAK